MRALAAPATALLLLLSACTGGSGTARPDDRPGDGGDRPGGGTVAGTESAAPRPGFTFAAAGDLGANAQTAEGLAQLDGSAAELFLALGDLDYDQTDSDEAWCDYVHERLPTKGPQFPFEVLVGNHEADGGPDGRIGNHAACLPDRLGAEGTYGAQYAIDHPAGSPLARLILVAPGLSVDGHAYDYRRGTEDRAWLAHQISEAKRDGLWVVVGMHFPCISQGRAHGGCESGRAVHNLVLRRGADLLLTGHNHIYERSKQIRLSSSCPRVGARFDPDCVTDPGGDTYRRGRGTVQVTSGRFGGRYQGVDPDDPDRRWFVNAAGGTTGFVQVAVTAGRLEVRYVRTSGRMRDAFVIR